MKIRNLPYNKLSKTEKKVVSAFWKERICDNKICNKNIETFWENHREIDTRNGTYEGWKRK